MEELTLGHTAEAYQQRESGYSPDPIREALWNIIGKDLQGDVLDAGSGAGGWTRMLVERASHIVSVDLVDVGASKLPVEFHLADLAKDRLPADDSSLDWITALEIIEHLTNPRHFVSEAARCLKVGGRLAITTPCVESITAKLSYVLRGYFPDFCEHDYHVTGHITPITELDMRRMAQESGFTNVRFYYPLPGRIPSLSIYWQKLLPFLKGKAWSGTMIAILTR